MFIYTDGIERHFLLFPLTIFAISESACFRIETSYCVYYLSCVWGKEISLY